MYVQVLSRLFNVITFSIRCNVCRFFFNLVQYHTYQIYYDNLMIPLSLSINRSNYQLYLILGSIPIKIIGIDLLIFLIFVFFFYQLFKRKRINEDILPQPHASVGLFNESIHLSIILNFGIDFLYKIGIDSVIY